MIRFVKCFENGFTNYLCISSIVYFLLTCFSTIIVEEKIKKEEEKVKDSLSDIVNYYQNKAKNVNAKKINKLTKNFNIKQKEIIKFIKVIGNFKKFKVKRGD